MEKMKQVAKMDKILKTTGVMKREEYFNDEEKKMLQDIDYLKKHGYEDDFEWFYLIKWTNWGDRFASQLKALQNSENCGEAPIC